MTILERAAEGASIGCKLGFVVGLWVFAASKNEMTRNPQLALPLVLGGLTFMGVGSVVGATIGTAYGVGETAHQVFFQPAQSDSLLQSQQSRAPVPTPYQ